MTDTHDDFVGTHRLQVRPNVRQFEVGDELVLLARFEGKEAGVGGSRIEAATLNASGSAIWQLCDGHNTMQDIAAQLATKFSVNSGVLLEQVQALVNTLFSKGLLVRPPDLTGDHPVTVFAIGIEDRPYFWWQVGIFLESIQGKLPFGWRPFIVVCNNHKPLSPQLLHIFKTYHVDYECSISHGDSNPVDPNAEQDRFHIGFNKIEALKIAGQHVDRSELIFLLDSDVFLYNELDLKIMPTGCALARNWHVEESIFLASIAENKDSGVDLHKLLSAIGTKQEFLPGAVNIFVSGEVAKDPKFAIDCFRFGQVTMLLGKIAGAPKYWISEMPCYGLALTAHNIEYELLEQKQLLASYGTEHEIPTGTFYHYYKDKIDGDRFGAFYRSDWRKQDYRDSNFLDLDMSEFLEKSSSDHERFFFELAQSAKERLYE